MPPAISLELSYPPSLSLNLCLIVGEAGRRLMFVGRKIYVIGSGVVINKT